MEFKFRSVVLERKLGNEDVFLVFSKDAILFSNGAVIEHLGWESNFQEDGYLRNTLGEFFSRIEPIELEPLQSQVEEEFGRVWDIEGRQIEGIGKVCFALGRKVDLPLASEVHSESSDDPTIFHQVGAKSGFSLEPLLSNLSTLFLHMDSQSLAMIFSEALAKVGSHLEADCCAVFLVNSVKNIFESGYEWHRDGTKASKKALEGVSLQGKQALLDQLVTDGSLIVPSTVDSPWEALEGHNLPNLGIQSMALVPILVDKELFALLFIGSSLAYKYTEESLNGLHILRHLGDVFGSAVVNQREKSTRFRNERLLQETELLAKSGSWRFLNAEKKIFLSKGLRRLFDLDDQHESMALDQFFKLVSPDERKFVRQELKRVLRTNEAVSGEFHHVVPNQPDRIISYQIQVNQLSPQKQLEVFGICTDITDRKALEERLLLESQILAQVNESIFVTDLAYQVIYMNREAQALSGIDSGFRGSIDEIFQLPNAPAETLTALAERYLRDGVCQDTFKLRDNGGRIFDCRANFSVILDKMGTAIGFSFLVDNVTEDREREELAKKAKLIVEKSPAVLFTLDPTKHFQITYVTENISQFGYKAKDLILEGVSFLDMIHPQDLPAYLTSFKQSEQHARTREYRIRTSRGKFLWVEDKVSEIRVVNGEICWYEGLFQDITEKKKDRAEIEKVKNQYRVLASNIPYTNVFLIDPDYRYIVAEGPNFEYWGLDKEYFEGKTIEQANTTNFEVILPLFKKAKKIRQMVSMDLKYIKRVYQLIAMPIFEGDELEYFLGIIRDITRERSIQQALEKSEQKYRNLVEESTELIFSIDTGLSVSYVSPNIRQFLGYETFEFTGGGFLDYLHPDDRVALDQHTKKNPLSYFEKKPMFDCRMRHRNGSYRIFSVSGKLIHDEKGEVKYYSGIARDNTKLKETQRELLIAKERAEKALEAKSQFLSVMSHEIRTPMNAVIGLSHLLLEENPREDQLENLRTLQFSAENLLGLINDILDFNKIDSGKIELEYVVFEPQHLLNRIVRSYAYQIREKSLELVLDVSTDLPRYVMGDPVRLSQILNNLISNAVKFTKTGKVEITMSQVRKTGKAVTINFCVKDSGIGIPADKLDYVFEAFTQASSDTTRKFGGTGLGLAIVKKLVLLLGSDIEVESTEGKGTSFWFDLTFDLAAKDFSKGAPEVQVLKDLHNTSILVAEDNVVNQVLLKKYLTKWGVGNIEFAQNGQLALELFEKRDFDILLIDLQMPVMDGLEMSKEIRAMEKESKKRVPLIALTASSYSEVHEQLNKAGMDDYVSKPFNPADLYAKIIKYL
ncbi:MAG: PAS domain S-box protein [Lunatimonas sp.]|uniref:PAS domain S-box protein n=1 Tax=Lunatimonas sp. TaxID=2060141 RepID=UPI00263ABB64|nr:PAS domain S-box protein [Lunatimonas sp.]MCC5937500.1 PAS domain S-box protein [Lunatimonas sp.]